MAVNKLMGFYELQSMSLPVIPWKEYSNEENFVEEYLWTVRSAVYQGDDLNLPRLVGAKADCAKMFAKKLSYEMKDNGIVIYYPYFVAKKSGTLEVRNNKLIIEAVESDLWNMVTFSERNITIQYIDNQEIIDGNSNFLSAEEKRSILSYVGEIKKKFRDDLVEGKSVLLEWSYAQNCNIDKKPVGDEYLVFYEVRTV